MEASPLFLLILNILTNVIFRGKISKIFTRAMCPNKMRMAIWQILRAKYRGEEPLQ